jgi:hypothetical protein
VQHEISHFIFAADQGLVDVSYPVSTLSPAFPYFLSHYPFLCCWFRRRNSDWSDVPLNRRNWSSVIKSTLLVKWFYVQNSFLCTIYNFWPVCFPSVQHFGYNLTVCLEIWKRYCRRFTSRLWPKIATLLQISLELEQLLGIWYPLAQFLDPLNQSVVQNLLVSTK